jgi:hypothetical protein
MEAEENFNYYELKQIIKIVGEYQQTKTLLAKQSSENHYTNTEGPTATRLIKPTFRDNITFSKQCKC